MKDQDILTVLERILETQESIRSGVDVCADAGLVYLGIYYRRLPESVSKRLTEVDPRAVAAIPGAVSPKGTAAMRQELAGKLAGDAAFAQVRRAAGSYRKKLESPEMEGGSN